MIPEEATSWPEWADPLYEAAEETLRLCLPERFVAPSIVAPGARGSSRAGRERRSPIRCPKQRGGDRMAEEVSGGGADASSEKLVGTYGASLAP